MKINGLTCDSIQTNELINVMISALKHFDPRLINHGERVAYIAYEIYKEMDSRSHIDLKVLMILSVFHDMGAFKTEEVDKMLDFDCDDSLQHSLYGYLFFKYLSPLHDYAEVLRYHHTPNPKLQTYNLKHTLYVEIIYLSDRLDVLMKQHNVSDLLNIIQQSSEKFNIDLLANLTPERVETIKDNLDSGYYLESLKNEFVHFVFSKEETLEYLKMLIYSIDFRSEQTVTHTMSIIAVTFSLAKYLNISSDDYQKLYLGALLHDIGKIAIPNAILESPEQLNEEDMQIMKTHVQYTESIISGIVSDEICNLAIRHHEKLDGTGYPYGLNATDLSLYEQLIAVADIFSALISKRSYKDSFSKEKVTHILMTLSCEKKLNYSICDLAVKHYDEIFNHASMASEHIRDLYRQLHQEYLMNIS